MQTGSVVGFLPYSGRGVDLIFFSRCVPTVGAMAVSIYLVDDNLTFLNAVHRFLEQLPDVKVVGQCTRGMDALAHIERELPDCVLLDLALPDINGLDVGRVLSCWKQPPHIIILSMYDSAGYVAMAETLGVLAFVNKADFVGELPVLLGSLGAQPARCTCK